MVRKIMAVVPSFALVFMLVCGPLMADAHPASAGERHGMEMGMKEDANCQHDADGRGDRGPTVPAGHHDMSGAACCSTVCHGYVLTAPSLTQPLFIGAITTISYLQIIPTNQSAPLYHPPKA